MASRRREAADAALVAVADHAGAAADVAFLDGARVRGVERMHGVFGLDVEAIDVVQPAIPGFGYDRQRPIEPGRIRPGARHTPLDHRVAHHPHAVGVGDHHRPFEKSRLFDPCRSGHLAVAVLRKPGGEHGIGKRVRTPRQHGGHSGAHGTVAQL